MIGSQANRIRRIGLLRDQIALAIKSNVVEQKTLRVQRDLRENKNNNYGTKYYFNSNSGGNPLDNVQSVVYQQ